MRIASQTSSGGNRSRSAFTLVEVCVALGISTLIFSGMIVGYIQTARRAEWSGYSLAAQALAVQELEAARAGVWDPSLATNRNDLTNLVNLKSWTNNAGVWSGYSVDTLDIPVQGSNYVYATNYVSVKMIWLNNVTNQNYKVQMVRVDTVWPWRRYSTNANSLVLFTNTLATYLAPDNRDANGL